MHKKFKYIIPIVLIVIIVSTSLIGCSSDKLLNKQAKKLNTYSIDLNIDTDNMTVSAYEKLEYRNRSDSMIESLIFHLYPTAFSEDATIFPYSSVSEARCFPSGISYGDIYIKEVKENGHITDFKIVGSDNDKLEIVLNNALDIDEKTTIEIFFDLKIPNCTHRFGYYENNINLGNFYPILSVRENGEYDMTPYYSSGDPFYSDCANYNVNVKVDKDYMVFASGNKVSEKIENGNLSMSFEAKAIRDFALVLGSNFETKTVTAGKVVVNYAGYKGDSNINELTELSKKAVNYFSENFTQYPYKELNVVKTPFVHGGMEYSGLVMISDTIQEIEENNKVIVHEIAHQWWYGLVGVNETKDAWIDEGLAEYSTALFFDNHGEYKILYNDIINDAITSYTLYVDVISSINGKINTKMNIPVNEYINEYEYTYMIYIKGTILFDDLSVIVGREKLIKALEKLCKQYRFKNITTDIFTESIKSYTHKNTDTFFTNYLNGDVIIGKLR